MKLRCTTACNSCNKLTVTVNLDNETEGSKYRKPGLKAQIQNIVDQISDLDLDTKNDCMIIGKVCSKLELNPADTTGQVYIVECLSTRERFKTKKVYTHVDLAELPPEQIDLLLHTDCIGVFRGLMSVNRTQKGRTSLIYVTHCDIIEGVTGLQFGKWDSELYFRTNSNRVVLEGEVVKITTCEQNDEFIKRFVFQYTGLNDTPYKVNCYMKSSDLNQLELIQEGSKFTLIGSLLVYQDRASEEVYYIYQLRVYALAK